MKSIPKPARKKYITKPLKAIAWALCCPILGTIGACWCGYSILEHKITGKPQSGYCGTGYRERVLKWEALKAEKPKPLPKRRKRALTLPDVSSRASLFGSRKATCDQSQSMFFARLPREIRDLIYAQLLASAVDFHIYRRVDRRLGHFSCERVHHKRCPPGLAWGRDQTASGAWEVGKRERDHDDLLGLLVTCRRVYSEAINILYAENTFSFVDLRAMEYFQQSILPKRYARATLLDLE